MGSIFGYRANVINYTEETNYEYHSIDYSSGAQIIVNNGTPTAQVSFMTRLAGGQEIAQLQSKTVFI